MTARDLAPGEWEGSASGWYLVFWNGSPVGNTSKDDHGFVGWMPDGRNSGHVETIEEAEQWVRDRYRELWGGKPGEEDEGWVVKQYDEEEGL